MFDDRRKNIQQRWKYFLAGGQSERNIGFTFYTLSGYILKAFVLLNERGTPRMKMIHAMGFTSSIIGCWFFIEFGKKGVRRSTAKKIKKWIMGLVNLPKSVEPIQLKVLEYCGGKATKVVVGLSPENPK